MRIDVTGLETGQVVRREFREPVDSQSADVVFDAPVIGRVEVERTVRTVRLKAQAGTTAPMVCGRCLGAFRQQLRVSLDEEFLLEGAAAARGELGPEDFQLPLGSEQVLDASEVIRQHLLLGVPMVPVCASDCHGLCPRCGANLNERACGCEVTTSDSRLAPLKEKLRDEGIMG